MKLKYILFAVLCAQATSQRVDEFDKDSDIPVYNPKDGHPIESNESPVPPVSDTEKSEFQTTNDRAEARADFFRHIRNPWSSRTFQSEQDCVINGLPCDSRNLQEVLTRSLETHKLPIRVERSEDIPHMGEVGPEERGQIHHSEGLGINLDDDEELDEDEFGQDPGEHFKQYSSLDEKPMETPGFLNP